MTNSADQTGSGIKAESCAVVGTSVLRPDAPEKLTGRAQYVGDMHIPNMLYASVVRSPYAKAKILGINTETARQMPGVHAVLTHKDIPGQNIVLLVFKDLPVLAVDEVDFIAQPVALVAAETKEQAEAAAACVQVEYEELPGSFTIEEGFEKKWILSHYQQFKGQDVDPIFNNPPAGVRIFEDVFTTSHQEHAYLETNGILVDFDSRGGLVVYGSMQCPFYVQKGVAFALGLDYQKVRVIQMTTGGGFGGKEDGPSTPACLAALLAWHTRRPVKLIYSRDEDMASMSKRHPSKTIFRSAVDQDGKIVAVDIHYFIDGGAFITLSSIVLWRGILHAAGPYKIPNARILADCIGTNSVPNGAFRGFGQPQVCFAADCHWDKVAAEMHMDPVAFRRLNMLQVGDTTTSGQVLDESVGFDEVIGKVCQEVEYDKLKALPAQTGRYRCGVGVSVAHYGVGLGANGGPLNNAGANVVIAVDGSVSVAVGTAEIGQGMTTVLLQIASEVLHCPMNRLYLADSDTSQVPESGPTVASRTTLFCGNAVRFACEKIRERLDKQQAGREMTWDELISECWVKGVQLSEQGWAIGNKNLSFDQQTGQGNTYLVYTWCANAADVTVDTYTGEIHINKFVSGQDIGRAINPQLVEGQIQGGALQGIGYALCEEMLLEKGRIKNGTLSTYILPTSMDVPEIVPIIVEHNFSWGPFGAKGFGETPLVPAAPAIVNAVANAVGIRLSHIPATPERVLQALKEKK